MRQSLHRRLPKRNFWNVSRDRSLAAAREIAAAVSLRPPGDGAGRTGDAAAPLSHPADSGSGKA